MLRTPLAQISLQIKIMKLGRISEVLATALEPPSAEAVAASVEVFLGSAPYAVVSLTSCPDAGRLQGTHPGD